MKNGTKRLFALMLGLMMLVLSGTTAFAFDGKVLVGCTVMLTGPNQLTGSYYKNGVQMAIDEINAAGGILGKEVVIEYADEGSDPQTAVNACQKLISMDVKAIFGSTTSTNCKAMMPSIMEANIPYFADGSNPTMADEGKPWLWQVRVRDSLTAPIMANVFANDVGVKNPAVVYGTAESTTLATETFVKTYGELGYEIKQDNMYAVVETETNFTNIIAQIMESDCDGVYAQIVNADQAVVFAQQLLAAGFKGPKMGNSVFCSPEVRNADPVAAEDWYIVVEWSSSLIDVDLPKEIPQTAIDFETKFRAAYGMSSSASSAQGYDMVYLFKQACENAGTTEDRAAINEGFKTIDYQGAGNKYEYHDNNTITTYILVVQNKSGEAVPSLVIPTI